jgi:hypothetical protein
VIFAADFVKHGVNNKAIAAYSAAGAGSLGLTITAALAAAAFFWASGLARRDGMLGWSGTAISVAFVFTMTGTILLAVEYSDAGATGSYTAGTSIDAAGQGIAIGAGIVAAVAFFLSAGRQRRGQPWFRGREVLLGVASAVFAASFLVSAIGSLIVAGADSANGFNGKERAADWLTAVGTLGFVAAAALAAVGFFLSRERELAGVETGL